MTLTEYSLDKESNSFFIAIFALSFPYFMDGGSSCENEVPTKKIKNDVIANFFINIIFTNIHHFNDITKKI